MNKNSGFTLVELMIVVAIIGILASVSLSFYGNYVTEANRTDARATLSATAASLEKCKALNGRYDVNCNLTFPVASPSGFYSVSTTFNATGTSFTLTATPVSGTPQTHDAKCTTLNLTNTGVKGATGTYPNDCW